MTVGDRVCVKHVTKYDGYVGTITGPATQANMDVVVDLDGVGLLEFRQWEIEVIDTTDYTALTRDLAEILCPHRPGQDPCEACKDAAIRIMVHRRSVRRLLNRFANQEADL